MTTRWLHAAACSATFLNGACSLVVDELDLRCTQQSDCNALNEEHGLDLETDCFVYQCRSDGRGCEKRAQDLDGDHAPADVCLGQVPATTIDCDDNPNSGASRTPEKAEDCDGVDNNCDGRVDEGRALSLADERRETLPGTITALSAISLSNGQGLAIASVEHNAATAPRTLLNEIWGVIVDQEQSPAAKLLTGDGFTRKNCGAIGGGQASAKCTFSAATAFEGRDGLFTAATETAGCSGTARAVFGLEPSAVENESPAAWDWSEAMSTQGPVTVEPEAACEPAAGLVLAGSRHATDEPSALAAWWNPESSRLALARLTSTASTLRVVPGSAPHLPATSFDELPALVAFTGLTPGYLLAYAANDDDGCTGILLAHVTADSSRAPVPQQTSCLGAPGARRPVLATRSAGRDPPARERLALAWVDGDGAILFSSLHLEEGNAAVEAVPPVSVAKPIKSPDALSMAWIPDAQAKAVVGGRWILVWTDTCAGARCLQAAILGTDDREPLVAPFHLAQLEEAEEPLTAIMPLGRTLALMRAESSALHAGFLGCP